MKTPTQLIVLAYTKFGESSVVLHTLSREFGRRSFLVKIGKRTTMSLFLPLNILCKSIPAFLTIALMPLAYSISDGILIGVIAYVIMHAIAGKFKDISITMWVLAVLFVLRYI